MTLNKRSVNLTSPPFPKSIKLPGAQSQELDSAFFEKLYDAYAPTLYGLILRIVKDEYLAEKALLNAFDTIRKSYQVLAAENENLLVPFLKVARAEALAQKSAKTYEYRLLARELFTCQLYLADSRPIDWNKLDLEKLTKLPPRLSGIVNLLYFEGQSVQQVALHLSLTEQEVTLQLKEALLLLKKPA